MDILGHGGSRDGGCTGGGVHIVDIVGGRGVCGVLSPGHIAHAIPDSHIVKLSVTWYKTRVRMFLNTLCLD